MMWLTKLQSMLRLCKANKMPPIGELSEGLDPETLSQTRTFLRTTRGGAMLMLTLRNGMIESAMRCATTDGADKALWANGFAAGYMSAASVVDQFAGREQPEAQEQAGDPFDFGIAQ
jgi:hypothetical protein